LRIRMKGKHIVLSMAVILLLSGAVYAAAPGILYGRANVLAGRGENDLADRYYNLIVKRFPRSDEAVRALYFSAQREAAGGSGPDYINIFPSSMWTDGAHGSPSQLQSAIAKFELLRERYSESPWAVHALHEIGQAYYHLGEYDTAAEYLVQAVEESKMGKVESTQLLAEIYRRRDDYERALALVERSLAEKPNNDRLGMQRLKGLILMDMGCFEEAKDIFAALPEMAEKLYRELLADEGPGVKAQNLANWGEIATRYILRIDRLIQTGGTTGTITGRILRDGAGLANGRVYLIDREIYGDYNTSLTEDLPRVVTGSDGTFVFTGLAPGRYDLGVGVKVADIAGYTLRQSKEAVAVAAGETARRDLEFIPSVRLVAPLAGAAAVDKIAFIWEPVAGAVSYDVFWGPVLRRPDGTIASRYTSVWRSGITECTATLDVAAAAAQNRFTGSIAYDQDGIDPLSVLGPLYAGGEFTWGVYAYDAAGNRINDSSGSGFLVRNDVMPFFTLAGKTPGEADRLLLARDYAAAIAGYEKALDQNPQDAHSLLVLARLYQLGRRPEEADPARAADYYERFLAVEDVPEARQALAECYFRLGRDEAAYAQYADLAEADPDNWLYWYQMAKCKFASGEPEAALSLLRQVITRPDGKYARAYPVAVALLLEEDAAALDFARRVDGGADYLPLLRDYLGRGRRMPAGVRQTIRNGDYALALSSLGGGSYDRFIAALLTYANSRQYDHDEMRRLAGIIDDDATAQLLRRMLNLGQ
jgi:tetratricopeptide (TPR) repeat protein